MSFVPHYAAKAQTPSACTTPSLRGLRNSLPLRRRTTSGNRRRHVGLRRSAPALDACSQVGSRIEGIRNCGLGSACLGRSARSCATQTQLVAQRVEPAVSEAANATGPTPQIRANGRYWTFRELVVCANGPGPFAQIRPGRTGSSARSTAARPTNGPVGVRADVSHP